MTTVIGIMFFRRKVIRGKGTGPDNEPFGSRSEPGAWKPTTFLQLLPGEIPEGRAELVLSPGVFARQRTLEPVLEPGVTQRTGERC